MRKSYFSLIIKTEFSEKNNKIIIEKFLKERNKKNTMIFHENIK